MTTIDCILNMRLGFIFDRGDNGALIPRTIVNTYFEPSGAIARMAFDDRLLGCHRSHCGSRDSLH